MMMLAVTNLLGLKDLRNFLDVLQLGVQLGEGKLLPITCVVVVVKALQCVLKADQEPRLLAKLMTRFVGVNAM